MWDKFFQTSVWSIKFDPTFTAAKKGKRQGKSAVETIDKFTGSPTASSMSFGGDATSEAFLDDANALLMWAFQARQLGRPF